MLALIVSLILGGVLLASAAAKLASPRGSREATATYGITDPRAQAVAWALLVAVEAGLGAAVIGGLEPAAWAAAALMAIFAATLVATILRGRAGAPCACFGAASTVGWPAVARNLALAVGFAAIPLLPESELSTEAWLAIGVGVALLVCLGLVVAVLALAREVGMLRLRLGPASALEIPSEGPPVGAPSALGERLSLEGEAALGLAVFLSRSCHVCHGLRPAVATLRSDPMLSVETFEEEDDPELWNNVGVPGSPYAVALDRRGVTLAKGAFNNLAQLESVLGAAERRLRGELAGPVAAGEH